MTDPAPSVVVPDASVVAKWILTAETDAEDAIRLRDAYVDGEVALAMPALVLYEVASVLAHRSAIKLAEAGEFLGLVAALEIPMLQPDGVSLTAAIELARWYGVSLYDAVYVQFALDLAGWWVTADERAVRALPPDAPARTLTRWRAAHEEARSL